MRHSLRMLFLTMSGVALFGASGPEKILKSSWARAKTNRAFIDSLPQPRVAFPAQAPGPVVFAKILEDVGEFYPFTARYPRQEWDRKGYLALNTVVDGADLVTVTAETLAPLSDPATLVLRKGEGEGACVLPVLLEAEVNRDGSARVVLAGGDDASKAHAGKRLVSIDGEPLEQYFALRLGPKPGKERMAGCLAQVFTRRTPFRILLEFEDGSRLPVESVKTHPKTPWVSGGFRGVALHEVAMMDQKELEEVREIDARLLGWATLLGEPLVDKLQLVRRQALSRPVFRSYRAHQGYSEDSRFEKMVTPPYFSRYRSDALALDPFSDHPHSVEIWFPQGRVVNSVVDSLVGWGVDGALEWPLGASRIDLNSEWQVVMRTSTCLKHPPEGACIHSGSIKYGSSLTRRAALALAVARVLNFDQYYGNTPGPLQEALFAAAIKGYGQGGNVGEMLAGLGPFAKDAHFGNLNRLGVEFSTASRPSEAYENAGSLPGARKPLPFDLAVSPSGLTRVIWYYHWTDPVPIPIGAEILEIDGIPIKDLVARERSTHSAWSNCPISVGIRLQALLPNRPDHTFVYRDTAGKPQNAVVSERERSESIPKTPPKVGLPSNWTLLNQKGQISHPELLSRLGKGENFILDTRFHGLSVITSRRPYITNNPMPSGMFISQVENPMNWGTPDPERRFAAYIMPLPTEPPKEPLKGIVVMLLTGRDQSQFETTKTIYRMYLGESLYTIGFPTAGITGAISVLDIAGGESNSRYLHTPTGAWVCFGADTLSYRGMHLDEELDLEEVFRNGQEDPLLATVLRRVADHEVALAKSGAKEKPSFPGNRKK